MASKCITNSVCICIRNPKNDYGVMVNDSVLILIYTRAWILITIIILLFCPEQRKRRTADMMRQIFVYGIVVIIIFSIPCL
jgi:hypothetical protein